MMTKDHADRWRLNGTQHAAAHPPGGDQWDNWEEVAPLYKEGIYALLITSPPDPHHPASYAPGLPCLLKEIRRRRRALMLALKRLGYKGFDDV
jgi:hypothetical protein